MITMVMSSMTCFFAWLTLYFSKALVMILAYMQKQNQRKVINQIIQHSNLSYYSIIILLFLTRRYVGPFGSTVHEQTVANSQSTNSYE